MGACCGATNHSKYSSEHSQHVVSKHKNGTEDHNNGQEQEELQKIAKIQGTRRRMSIACESVSNSAVKDYVKPIYAKDDSTKQHIRNVLKGNEKMQVLFGHLDGTLLEDIINAFEETTVHQGIDIIKQGDQGDCLYIVSEGEVDVFVARPGPDGTMPPGKGSKVISLSSGSLFGELALMYSAPRAATVEIASPECKLWKLDREPFKMLSAQNNENKYEMYEGWLSEVDILKCLNHHEVSKLSELLQSHLYNKDEVIITQGQPGDKFYILEDGTCSAFISGTEGEKKVKDYEKQGEYFGEIALLKEVPRKATVRATGSGATVLWISKEDFIAVLGPIQGSLRKDVDKYSQYADFLK